MKKALYLTYLICLFAGSTVQAAQPADNTVAIAPMDNVELAKLLLKPVQKELIITRDPFKPLITKPAPVPLGGSALAKTDIPVEEEKLDVEFIGVVKLDDQYVAYLKTPKKKGTFQVNDKIENFTIQNIGMDQIVFKSASNNEIIKKRGKV